MHPLPQISQLQQLLELALIVVVVDQGEPIVAISADLVVVTLVQSVCVQSTTRRLSVSAA
jgi:hypothetical protein